MTLRALLVDDERLARVYLRELLAAHADVLVVGEAATVAQAAAAAAAAAPDVVFLDIQLRGETGFDLLPDLDGRGAVRPQVVFVTAFDQHAIRAFEVNAIDYLLKPVEPERLARTLARVRAQAARPAGDGDAQATGREVAGDGASARPLQLDDRLFLEIGRRVQFVAVRDVLAVLADDDYTTLVLRDGRRPLVATTLATWEARLPATEFVRIHRGALVQFAAVTAIEPWSHGTYQVRIAGVAEPVAMSRRVARVLRRRLS